MKHEKLKRCSLKLTTFLSGKRIAEAATCNLNILDIDAAKCVLVLFSRHHVSPDLNHRFWASTEFSEAGTVEFPKSPTSSAAMLPQMPQTRTTMTHPGEGCYGRIVLLHICIKIMIIIILHKNHYECMVPWNKTCTNKTMKYNEITNMHSGMLHEKNIFEDF